MPKQVRVLVQWALLLGALLLAGCAVSPDSVPVQQSSEALLEQQLARLRQVVQQTPPRERVLVYLGFAMHSNSRAFEGDALLGQQVFGTLNPNFASVVLSNQPQSAALVHPFATQATLDRTFSEVGRAIQGRNAAVVVLVSTHGAADLLTVNIANKYQPAVRARQLGPWLARLGEVPTVVVLSACHAGSFVEPLKAPRRAILAAAAPDRASFGCSATSKNTFFTEELLGRGFSGDLSWSRWFEQTVRGVEERERRMGMKPPSNPQAALFSGNLAASSVKSVLGK